MQEDSFFHYFLTKGNPAFVMCIITASALLFFNGFGIWIDYNAPLFGETFFESTVRYLLPDAPEFSFVFISLLFFSILGASLSAFVGFYVVYFGDNGRWLAALGTVIVLLALSVTFASLVYVYPSA